MLVIRKEYKVIVGVGAAVLGIAALYGVMALLSGIGKTPEEAIASGSGEISTVTVNIPDTDSQQSLESSKMGLPPVDTTESATTTDPKSKESDQFAESSRKDGKSNDDIWTTAWNTGKVSTDSNLPLLIKTGEPGKTDSRIIEGISPARVDEPKTAGNTKTNNGSILTTGTYIIQPGDNYSRIANKLYGNKNLYSIIEKANPGIEPTKLKPGMTIKVPPMETVQLDRGAISTEAEVIGAIDTKNQYKVSSGDTLHKIAQKLYGKTAMWQAIYDINKSKIGPDAGKLRVGTVLSLPQTPVIN